MFYVGIDLHRRFLVVSVVNEQGEKQSSRRFECCEVLEIREYFDSLDTFKAVIEASSSYRWLYDLVSKYGKVVLAHPYRLRAIVAGRAKTDKLDARLLANLLRVNMIPKSYVPPADYQSLREATRQRAALVYETTGAKNELHALLGRANYHSPYKSVFCKRGRKWIAGQEWDFVNRNMVEEKLRRIEYFEGEIKLADEQLEALSEHFPETKALTCLFGIGLYSALLLVAEIGEPWRFTREGQVGAYAGLTSRVSQSGEKARYGSISKQGSRWMRYILVNSAMHLVRRDKQLGNFYRRIKRRSGFKVARVAAARKLAEICWKRLMAYYREQEIA